MLDIFFLITGLYMIFKKEIRISSKKSVKGKIAQKIGLIFVIPAVIGYSLKIIPKSLFSVVMAYISLAGYIIAFIILIYFVFFYKENNKEKEVSSINTQPPEHLKNKTNRKILNFLLVSRKETENKWWHRLFTVLLFGSGIIVFIFAIVITVDSYHHGWTNYRPIAFSLEPNYQETKGEELPCSESIDFSKYGSSSKKEDLSTTIVCKGVNISLSDSKRYEELYEAEHVKLEKQFGLDKYNGICSNMRNTQGAGLSEEEIICIRKNVIEREADPAYYEYQNSLKDIAKIKVVQDTNFGTMFYDIFLWLIIPLFAFLLWIVFWSTIIYRLVLYVIFGKRK